MEYLSRKKYDKKCNDIKRMLNILIILAVVKSVCFLTT